MSWFVVGGIAIGATAGAIVGSKKGGDDVWKDALIGGAIGGTAGYGAGAIGAAEAAAPAAVAGEGGAGIMGAEGIAGGAIAPELVGVGGSMAAETPAGIAMASQAAPTAATAAPQVGAGIMGSGAAPAALPSGAGGFGSAGGASISSTGGFAPGMQAPIQMVSAPEAAFGSSSLPTGATALPGGEAFGGSGGATVGEPGGAYNLGAAQQSPLEKGFSSAMNWVTDNPMKAGILGLTALSATGALNKDNNQTFGNATVTPAGYPLSPNFQPSRANPQQYRYKSSYADGGEVGMAAGGVQQTGMFPQSQMDKTQFASPSQMPVSREIIGSDYDATINPYTGDLPRFAEGGSTKDYGHQAKQYAAMLTPQTSAPDTPEWVRSRGIYHDEDQDTAYQDALTAAQTRMGKAAGRANVQLAAMQKPTPMGKLNLGPVAGGEEERKASGGITTLGSYAHGGNARLLRGPGDGMSDDIPASIGDKQPARLADGEFVVPADVVSGLGNGSTEAGAKKLHQMMDKVRVDRTGTKKQGKQIKADKYIPGMKEGGIASYAAGNLVVNPETNEVGYYTGQNEWGFGGTWTPVTSEQYQTATSTPIAPTQPIQPQVNPSQYAMGGQYTPDYRTPGSALGSGLGRWNNLANTASMESRPASFNQQVTQAYLNNLGRAPDQMGFNQAMQSGLNPQQINQALGVSGEAVQLNPANQVKQNTYIQDLFQQYLGRNPEAAGQAYWAQQMAKSPATGAFDVMQGIANSPEAQVRQAFKDYLGRTPEAAGQQYWQQQMAQGMTPEQMRSAVQTSTEGQAFAKKRTEAATPAEKKRKGGILAAK